MSVHFLQRLHWRDVEASRRFLLLTGQWPETWSGNWRTQSETERVSAGVMEMAGVWGKLTVSLRPTLHSQGVHPHCRTVLLPPPETEYQSVRELRNEPSYLIRGCPDLGQ